MVSTPQMMALPSNITYEIDQDSSGFIWMGTENGILTYDGERFERFSDSRLKDNDLIQLEISKDGHITFSNVSRKTTKLSSYKAKGDYGHYIIQARKICIVWCEAKSNHTLFLY